MLQPKYFLWKWLEIILGIIFSILIYSKKLFFYLISLHNSTIREYTPGHVGFMIYEGVYKKVKT